MTMRTLIELFPGIVVVVILSALAVLLNQFFGFNTLLIAISLGFVVGNLVSLPTTFKTGIKWTESKSLAVAVALLGVQLNFSLLMQINPITLSLIALSIIVTFVVTLWLAKMFRINRVEACLVASGEAICGSAAVMAAAKVLHAPKVPVGLIIAVVNFLGFLGVFLTPWLIQQFFHANDANSGFLIGNTLQSMGHVVAAGFAVNETVGQGAVLIKMCRILFLIPTLLVLMFWVTRQSNKITTVDTDELNGQISNNKTSLLKLIPLFIWFFLAFILITNLGWIPTDMKQVMIQLSDLLFVLAMVAIGMNIRMQDIWQQGGRLLLMASVVFVVQIVFTLMLLKLS